MIPPRLVIVRNWRDLGAHLRNHRTESDVLLKQICNRTGVAPSTLSAFELGVSGPGLQVLVRLVPAYGYNLALIHQEDT